MCLSKIVLVVFCVFCSGCAFTTSELPKYDTDLRKWGVAHDQSHTRLLLTEIVRDEEQNLNLTLPVWSKIVDSYAIGVDSRTKDNTVEVIKKYLGHLPGVILNVTFEGFGPTRTHVLQEGLKLFPQTTHIMCAEADWLPLTDTFDREELDLSSVWYNFGIEEENEAASWVKRATLLVRNRPGIHMKYKMHEQIDIPPLFAMEQMERQHIDFTVKEIRGGAMQRTSANRHLNEIPLLELDRAQAPQDIHTRYYLGVAYSLAARNLPDADERKYTFFAKAIDSFMACTEPAMPEQLKMSPLWELVYAAHFHLAHIYHYDFRDNEEAVRWYKKCTEFDPERGDPYVELSRIFSNVFDDIDTAWSYISKGIRLKAPNRNYQSNLLVYRCIIPTETVRLLSIKPNLVEKGESFARELVSFMEDKGCHTQIYFEKFK